MQVMFVLGLEFALTMFDTRAPNGLTGIALQDDMTFVGPAAALDRSWNDLESRLAQAGHRLRGCKCGVWALGFEQFEDRELPLEIRNLCAKVPRKRLGSSLLGSAANVQHCMHVDLGLPAEAPTLTVERLEKALETLHSRTTRGGWQGSRAMQQMYVLGPEFALSRSDDLAPREIMRIGPQDDMTFIGSAAALNRYWSTIEGVLAEADHRLRSCKCGVWAPGFEQFADAELPMEVRNLCLKVPHKGHGVGFLGSAANAEHWMHVGLGPPAEVPTQTTERVEKALMTLQSTERCACDQHDHVSFAKAWILMSKGVAHALN